MAAIDSIYKESASEAATAVRANLSPRYMRIDRLEQFVETTQYEGKADWFSEGEDAPPLRERKPCIQYPIVANAIESNTDLCLGEGRFPSVTLSDDDSLESDNESEGSEDDDSEEECPRALADKWLARLTKTARMKPAIRLGFSQAQGCRSVAAILGWRYGKPFTEIEKAKWCTPTFGPDKRTVTKLEIQYPFTKEERDERGRWVVRAYLYRRVINEQSDITYHPIVADKNGLGVPDSAWRVDKSQSFEHGFGFCPVVWYPFMIGATTCERIDGRAIHERCLDEIVCHDIALSQRHRAASYVGDPQLVGYGLEELPGGVGRTLAAFREANLSQAFNTADGNTVDTFVGEVDGKYATLRGGVSQGQSLKKGASQFWKIDSEKAKVEMLTLPADALDAIDKDARDLRNKIAESLAVVFTDPESVRFATALSGKAQQMLRQRQFDRCSQYREDLADNFIIPVYQMHIRIAQNLATRIAATGQRMHRLLQGVGVFSQFDEIGLELQWGDFIDPDAEEDLNVARFVNEVDKALPLPDDVKVRKLARSLGIDNPGDLIARLKEERHERHEREQESLAAEAEAFHAKAVSINGAVGARDRGTAGANQEADAGSGSSPVAAPPPARQHVPQREQYTGGS